MSIFCGGVYFVNAEKPIIDNTLLMQVHMVQAICMQNFHQQSCIDML